MTENLHSLLYKNPFYERPNYLETSKQNLSQLDPLPASFKIETQKNITRLFLKIISIIIFPIAIYRGIQTLIGKVAILPASNTFFTGYTKERIAQIRSQIDLTRKWKYLRTTIEIDDIKLDVIIVGKKETFNNGRWMLASNGNCEIYENKLVDKDFTKYLKHFNSNGIVFNYPGVVASTGLPIKADLKKAQLAMFRAVEDSNNGLGAKQIIAFGHSLGGGVQGEALKAYVPRADIQYLFMKSMTFSNLRMAASHMIGRYLDLAVDFFDCDLDSVESSKKLRCPEIVFQRAKGNKVIELVESSAIMHDGVIPEEASLAKALLENKPWVGPKLILGVPETHNEPLNNLPFLASIVEQFFKLRTYQISP